MLPFGIGFSEIVVIGIVLLLVVGPHKLPDLAKTMGKGLRVVRRAANELKNAIDVEEVKAVRRELTRPLHDWKNDDEPEDMELGPDGVLRPVRRNGPKPTPKAAPRPAESPVAKIADNAPVSLGKSGGPDGDSGPAAGLMLAKSADAPAAVDADEGDEEDDDEVEPVAHRPAASVARHDPLFDRIRTEIERTAATVEATAGHAEAEVLATRNAPVSREAAVELPDRPAAEDTDGPDRPARARNGG